MLFSPFIALRYSPLIKHRGYISHIRECCSSTVVYVFCSSTVVYVLIRYSITVTNLCCVCGTLNAKVSAPQTLESEHPGFKQMMF